MKKSIFLLSLIGIFYTFFLVGCSEEITTIEPTTLVPTTIIPTTTITNNTETFYVRFNSDGGTVFEDLDEIVYGSTISLPTPIKQGYVFKGWYFSYLPNSQGFNESSLVVGNTELYARWELAEYLVCFYDFSGVILHSEYVKYGASAHAPEVPIRNGYTFIGWNEDYLMVISDLTVEAQYEESKQNLYFDVAGGEHINPLEDVLWSEIINLPVPLKPGYDFLGWYLDGFKVDNVFTFSYMEDITLIAHWQVIPEGLVYYETDYEIILVEYLGTNPYLVLPDTINGKPIKTISEAMFKDNLVIQSIVIGKYVIDIEDEAFMGALNLSQVIFPEDSELLNISNYAFSETNLVSFNLPSSVEMILFSAFSQTENLRQFNIQTDSNLLYIGENAFFGDILLESIFIPKKVTFIGNYAFAFNSRLSNVEFAENIELPTIGVETFRHCGITEIEIPSSVTLIGTSAFWECYYLESVTFGENSQLNEIMAGAFSNVPSLYHIFLPASLKFIRPFAFFGNENLITVVFEEGSQLLEIGDSAFQGNYQLIYINLPAGLQIIGQYAFYDCWNIAHILIPDTVQVIGAQAFAMTFNMFIYSAQGGPLPTWDVNWYDDERPVVWGIHGYGIEEDLIYAIVDVDSVVIIGRYYFSEKLDLIIPSTIQGKTVTTIQENAFKNLVLSVNSITIPITVIAVGDNAFDNYYGLINAYATEQPTGWSPIWNPDFATVVWGYTP